MDYVDILNSTAFQELAIIVFVAGFTLFLHLHAGERIGEDGKPINMWKTWIQLNLIIVGFLYNSVILDIAIVYWILGWSSKIEWLRTWPAAIAINILLSEIFSSSIMNEHGTLILATIIMLLIIAILVRRIALKFFGKYYLYAYGSIDDEPTVMGPFKTEKEASLRYQGGYIKGYRSVVKKHVFSPDRVIPVSGRLAWE